MKIKHTYLSFVVMLSIGLGACQPQAAANAGNNAEAANAEVQATSTLPGMVVDESVVEEVQATEAPAVVDEAVEETIEITAEPLVNGYLTQAELEMMEANRSDLDPYQWSSWPQVPEFNPYLKLLHERGLANGYMDNRYSALGDCQSMPGVFMGMYETLDEVVLGEDEGYLYETIDYYSGSFKHESLTVIDGLSPPTALSPMWNDPEQCDAAESPLDCELRVNQPGVMFINLGTNWKENASLENYEKYLREIIETLLAQGVVPVLSTKADNIEGGHRINALTANLAYEYQIPLWNFWAAADTLENHGLDGSRDSVYLSVEAWAMRSHLALQTLDGLHRLFGESE
jgi:hypothetical protein